MYFFLKGIGQTYSLDGINLDRVMSELRFRWKIKNKDTLKSMDSLSNPTNEQKNI